MDHNIFTLFNGKTLFVLQSNKKLTQKEFERLCIDNIKQATNNILSNQKSTLISGESILKELNNILINEYNFSEIDNLSFNISQTGPLLTFYDNDDSVLYRYIDQQYITKIDNHNSDILQNIIKNTLKE